MQVCQNIVRTLHSDPTFKPDKCGLNDILTSPLADTGASRLKVLGEDILPCLDRIQDPQASEVVPYIRKLVTEGVGKEGKSRDPGSSSKKKAQRFSKSDHEALADIFKKIGKKELSKVGLQELYNFKQQNPGADLEPFLAKSSQYFREYIERGLRGVELEVRAGSNVPPPPAASTTRTTILADSNNSGGQPAHLVYLERLKRLRAAGGLETQGQENLENITTSIPTSGYSSGVGSTYSASSRFSSTTETYQAAVDPESDPESEGPGHNTDYNRRLRTVQDSVVEQLMGQIRNMEDTVSSVLVALENGPDIGTSCRLNQIVSTLKISGGKEKVKGKSQDTYDTTIKLRANLEGVDDPGFAKIILSLTMEDYKSLRQCSWRLKERVELHCKNILILTARNKEDILAMKNLHLMPKKLNLENRRNLTDTGLLQLLAKCSAA